MQYLVIFFITFLFSIILTILVRFFAIKWQITDKPLVDRKVHKNEIPLLGGMAIFLAFFIMLYFTRNYITAGNLEIRHWLGFFSGGLFLMIGGYFDDKYNLPAGRQIIWPMVAALAVIIGGVEIEKITNPFSGYVYLGWLSGVLVFFWLMGMMYTTKLLDGLDGLVSGLTAIGSLIIFLFTMTTKYYQPDIGLAALILAAACLGFLIFNWQPAKIFLGEGGSLFLGFALGVLSIISGGKIAIALLVMGIPILDVFWTIIRRLAEGKNPFKIADKKHLHFRFLNLGLSARKTVLIYYGLSAVFGLSALFLQSRGKLLALVVLVILMFIIVISLSFLDRKKIEN